jgi:hypothetical protein
MPLGFYLTLRLASAYGTSEAEKPAPPKIPNLTLDVRVYNPARAAPKDLNRAFSITSQIFAQTGIKMVWAVEAADQTEIIEFTVFSKESGQSCPLPLRSRALALRIVRKAPPGIAETALGFALPCAIPMPTVTIFADRIEAVAQHTTAMYHPVLAHVIAHEIGHVLLRSSMHAEAGIMRARWDRADWQRASVGILEFTADESERMRAELQTLAIQASGSNQSIPRMGRR